MRVVYAPYAQQQLRNLRHYIARRSYPERADTFIRRIITYCDGFATFPERGSRRDDLVPGFRVTGFENRATIAFVVESDTVVIVGIYYGGQNFEDDFTEA